MVGRVLEEETMDIDYGGFFIKTIGATFFANLDLIDVVIITISIMQIVQASS